METQPIWRNLKALGEIDHRREQIQTKIESIEKQINEEKIVLPEIQEAMQELGREHINAKKSVDSEELKAENLRALESKKKKMLDNVHKPKELEALQSELEGIVNQIAEQEDVLIKSWHNLEKISEKIEEGKIKNKERIEQLEKEIVEHEKELVNLKAGLSSINDEWNKVIENIPDEWSNKYKNMCEHLSDPIVSVLNESCSACYYIVPSQNMSQLKKGEIISCRNCYRLLYYDEEEEKDTQSEAY